MVEGALGGFKCWFAKVNLLEAILPYPLLVPALRACWLLPTWFAAVAFCIFIVYVAVPKFCC